MKTHMNNTQAQMLANDIVNHTQFLNHQQHLHSNVKPLVVTRRKQQIKIVNNKKRQLNNDPNAHVHHLFKNLHSKTYKSTIDNKQTHYESGKEILSQKTKKNKQELYQKAEHERELRSMHDRISNCKNIQQRKKDNTDPITNPTYFIKKGESIADVSIEGYCKKILGKNRPKSGMPNRSSNLETSQTYHASNAKTVKQQQRPTTAFGSVPNYSKIRPQSAKVTNKANQRKGQDLPGCTFKQILNHIVNNKLFKDTDMKVLYVRLCHRYGEENVDQIWENLMDQLER